MDKTEAGKAKPWVTRIQTFTPQQYARLWQVCKDQGVKMTAYVRQAVEEKLEREG